MYLFVAVIGTKFIMKLWKISNFKAFLTKMKRKIRKKGWRIALFLRFFRCWLRICRAERERNRLLVLIMYRKLFRGRLEDWECQGFRFAGTCCCRRKIGNLYKGTGNNSRFSGFYCIFLRVAWKKKLSSAKISKF